MKPSSGWSAHSNITTGISLGREVTRTRWSSTSIINGKMGNCECHTDTRSHIVNSTYELIN